MKVNVNRKRRDFQPIEIELGIQSIDELIAFKQVILRIPMRHKEMLRELNMELYDIIKKETGSTDREMQDILRPRICRGRYD